MPPQSFDISRRLVLGCGMALLITPLARAQDQAGETPTALRLTAAAMGNESGGPAGPIVFDGSYAPPALRLRRKAPAVVDVANATDLPLSLHWHGLRAAVGTTGLTDVAVAPQETLSMAFSPPDAGLFLLEGRVVADPPPTARLMRLLIVADDEPPIADRDVVLAFVDAPGEAHAILVEGQPLVTLALKGNERARVRLANGSATLALAFAFEAVDAVMIALDGQPTNEPLPMSDRPFGLLPGGRAEFLVDAAAAPDWVGSLRVTGPAGETESVRLVRDPALARESPWPAAVALSPGDLPGEIDLEKATRATLTVDDGARTSLFSAPVGAPAVLTLVNPGETAVAAHLRGQCFRLLHAMDDGWEPYWLDTVLLAAGETRLVAFVPPLAGEWRVELRRPGDSAPFQLAAFTIT